MKKVFLLFISLIFLISLVSASSLNVEIRVDLLEDLENLLRFSLDSLSVDNVGFDDSFGENKLIFESVYEDGSVSETKEVGFDFYLPGSILIAYVTTAFTSFDFHEDLRYVKVYYDSEEVLSVDLSELCNNNDVCDDNENYLNCKDCEINAEDGLCMNAKENEGLRYWEDGLCDNDCYNDNDCMVLGSPIEKDNLVVYLALIVLIATVIYLVLKKRKKRKIRK
tara:strand:+ start:168 stop:836 length:669 start_codon:yes stop_codon:yes gene_type:complete